MVKTFSILSVLFFLASAAAFGAEGPTPGSDPAEVVDLLTGGSDVKLRRIGTVTFPIEISLDELQEMVNEKAPETFEKDKTNKKIHPVVKDAWMEYHIERGDIRLIPLTTHSGDVLGFEVPIKGKASAGGKFLRLMPTTVALDFRGSIVGSVRAALKPDWSPDVQVAFDATFDKASLKLFHTLSFPIKDHLNDELEEREADIEKRLLKQLDLLDLPKRITPYWAQLYKTIRISKSPPAWIQIKPHSLALSPFRFAPNRMVVFNSTVEVEAVTFLGEKPPDQAVGPLPPLNRLQEATTSFKVAAPTHVSLSSVGEFVTAKFLPAKIDVTESVSCTFRKIVLSGKDGCVCCAVEADAHGGVFGDKMPITLHATMMPKLDADKRELRFEKLKYTVETESFLANSASALLQPVVLAKLQEKTRFAFGDLLERSREKVNEIMVDKRAGKHLEVNVHFDKMDVTELSVVDSQIVIFADAEGALGLKVHPYKVLENEKKAAAEPAKPKQNDVTFRP